MPRRTLGNETMLTPPLSSEWAEHPGDLFRASFMDRYGARRIPADAGCPCDIAEHHEHCSHCGRVLSIGSGAARNH